MAEAFIDVELVEDLALPYESGAELWLEDWLGAAWQQVAALFPGIRLDPLFSGIDPFALVDMVDIARMRGEEPPDPFAWFEIPCDDAVIEDLLALVDTLPFVVFAGRRAPRALTGLVSFAAAVGADGLLYAAQRPLTLGGTWSALRPVDPAVRVSPLGGATVVANALSVSVFAVLPDGRPCRSDRVAPHWLALAPG